MRRFQIVFQVEDLSEIEIDTLPREQDVASLVNTRYSEAYSAFVAGRYPESQKILKVKDTWLENYIIEYFKNIDRFFIFRRNNKSLSIPNEKYST